MSEDKNRDKDAFSDSRNEQEKLPGSSFQGSEGGGSEEDLQDLGRLNTANNMEQNMSQRAHSQKQESKFPKEQQDRPETD